MNYQVRVKSDPASSFSDGSLGNQIWEQNLVRLCLFPHEEGNPFHPATRVLFHFPSYTLNIEMNIYQAELFPKL